MRHFIVILFCLFMACKGSESSASDVDLTLIMTDAYGGTPEPGIEVLRDEGSLRKYFARINRTRKPGLPVPEIDFSRHIAVAYSSGQTTDTIIPAIQAVNRNKDTLILKTQKSVASEATFTAVRLPFALYLLPRTDKQVVME